MDQPTMYVSEPIKGVESAFYANGRYYANAEDARRARLLVKPKCAWCGRYDAAFGVFCSRTCADAEVRS
jgi:hypothetical protein